MSFDEKMNYPFKIPPFGNWTVAEQAMETVINDAAISNERDDESFNQQELVGVLKYETGEQKMVFMLPVEYCNNIYNAAFPDPILLYLSISHNQYLLSEKIKLDFFKENSMGATGRMRMFNSVVNSTNETYNLYLQSRVCAIIMLHSSIEAFVNYAIPDNIQYPWTTQKGTKNLNKREIDKNLKFKDKLIDVVSFAYNIDLKNNHSNLTAEILNFYQVRNDFVHLKSYMENSFKASHTTVFNNMLNMDLVKYYRVAHEFMNLIKPNYISPIENK